MNKIKSITRNPLAVPLLGSLILLFTLLVTFADAKVSDFNSNLVQQQSIVNNYFIKYVGHTNTAHHYELLLNINLLFQKNDIRFIPESVNESQQGNFSPELQKITSDFREGKINSNEMFSKITEYYVNISDYVFTAYNDGVNNLNKQTKAGTIWVFWKQIFSFTQLILVLIVLVIPFLDKGSDDSRFGSAALLEKRRKIRKGL